MPDRESLTLAAVVAVCGFLLVTAVLAGHAERQEAAPRRAELIGLIAERRALVRDLDDAVEALRNDLDRAQARASRVDVRQREEAEAARALAVQAGTVAVEGEGLVVRLSPSTRTPPSPEEAGAYKVHDSDLQLVVNALFGAGAEAVAVNDSRVVATTPIRSAGGTIVVNFRPVSPPFVVEAIGADRRAFLHSDIARRFARWTGLFGLGFKVSESDGLTVPGYTGRVSISTASPATAGPPSTLPAAGG